MTAYIYNPHRHTKIWLSNTPDTFMNLENQVRLIKMREINPSDKISLVYDSTLLTPSAIEQLTFFCKEHQINPANAQDFKTQFKSENEKQLFTFYEDEIQYLQEGGNLAVASDILRWLSPVYQLGTYTDFDFPIDTNALPPTLVVNAPLVLNIGSLKIGKKEFILSNNDYIAIIDEVAAKEYIERAQSGIIEKLNTYDTDFIEQTEKQLGNSFIRRYMIKLMKNRPESYYISKSKEINKTPNSSRRTRKYIQQKMSQIHTFIEFNKIQQETDAEVKKRLKDNIKKQLNLIKYLFFNQEYVEIKSILKQDDDAILNYLMKREFNFYLKSIIVCTTGPLEIANSLFNGYVLDSQDFKQRVQPLSFNHYHLQKAFKSQNCIPLHENPLGMIRFLGVDEGQVNDSSWLEKGRILQERRTKKLEERQKELSITLPKSLLELREKIEEQLIHLSQNTDKFLFREQRKIKREILETTLACFHHEMNEYTFDINQFKTVLPSFYLHKKDVFSGLFLSQTKKLIKELEQLSHNAILFGLTTNRTIKLKVQPLKGTSEYKCMHKVYAKN